MLKRCKRRETHTDDFKNFPPQRQSMGVHQTQLTLLLLFVCAAADQQYVPLGASHIFAAPMT